MKRFNFYLLEYAVSYIFRYKSKNLFVFTILTSLIFILGSVFFLAESIKNELHFSVDGVGDIIVQNTKAGMHTTLDDTVVEKILDMQGVSNVESRVWGYYNFSQNNIHFLLLGVDEFEVHNNPLIDKVLENVELNDSSMIVSSGIKKLLEKSYYDKYFNFILEDGSTVQVQIIALLNEIIDFEANDMIIMKKELAQKIFGFENTMVSDLIIKVGNPKEIPMVAYKIQEKFPNTQVLTKEDIVASYEHVFNYKSGIFLTLFIVGFLTFFMIVYDKASGLSSEEKKEIGILKALGWRIDDILQAKLYEGFLLSMGAYLLGIGIALAYVYLLGAPFLRELFIAPNALTQDFRFSFTLDYETLFLLFLLSVPIYIAATIVPSWRVATQDADEVMR